MRGHYFGGRSEAGERFVGSSGGKVSGNITELKERNLTRERRLIYRKEEIRKTGKMIGRSATGVGSLCLFLRFRKGEWKV